MQDWQLAHRRGVEVKPSDRKEDVDNSSDETIIHANQLIKKKRKRNQESPTKDYNKELDFHI